MFICWDIRPLRTRRRSPCGHRGSRRQAITGYIAISSVAHPGGRYRLAVLPTIRTCCLKDLAARTAWWATMDRALERIRLMPTRRYKDPRIEAFLAKHRRHWDRELDEVIQGLESKVKRGRRDAAARSEARRAKEAVALAKAEEQAAVAARMVTSSCWSILELPPGSNYRRCLDAARDRKRRLNEEHAQMSKYQEMDDAFVEAIERLQTGVW